MGLRTGYTHEDAFESGYLQVTELHQVYFYQYGKRNGKPGKLLVNQHVKCIGMLM